MTLLRVERLSKDFGGVHAVAEVTFTVEPGRIHAIIGPNGAGKTTLFNLITGLYRPSAGSIFFHDHEITGQSPHNLAARGISRTFQNLQIFYNMSALENVMVGRHMHADTRLLPTLLRLPAIARSNRECVERAQALMAFVGLEDYLGEGAGALPNGGRKRRDNARALATQPELLLLDEPAAGCNASETAEIDALIQRVNESGVTVVLVEHDMRLVMGISDHLLVLDYGRLLAEGSADEVRANPEVIAAYLGAGAQGET